MHTKPFRVLNLAKSWGDRQPRRVGRHGVLRPILTVGTVSEDGRDGDRKGMSAGKVCVFKTACASRVSGCGLSGVCDSCPHGAGCRWQREGAGCDLRRTIALDSRIARGMPDRAVAGGDKDSAHLVSVAILDAGCGCIASATLNFGRSAMRCWPMTARRVCAPPSSRPAARGGRCCGWSSKAPSAISCAVCRICEAVAAVSRSAKRPLVLRIRRPSVTSGRPGDRAVEAMMAAVE